MKTDWSSGQCAQSPATTTNGAPDGGQITDGVVLLDKPVGLSSQQAVSRVKRRLAVKKAGHAGTLDPGASGLLIIGLGKATRLLGYLSADRKTYQATIRLGQATDSDDADGQALGQIRETEHLAPADIESGMSKLTGQILQRPSRVSAIKINGQRAYDLARQGADFELAARPVTVERFALLGQQRLGPFLDLMVEVSCSSGTYIRSLARDLGVDLGVGGHLTSLRRTSIGPVSVGSAVELEAVDSTHVYSMVEASGWIGQLIDVDSAQTVEDISHGRSIRLAVPAGPAMMVAGDRLLAIYQADASDRGLARPLVVFAPANQSQAGTDA
ncbi:MAG: tRNA pseudouridine(55) synthase TruB [Propionibacteriaceae bacterium]|jgi:tRNA pseudouridine55 synthase|nr:tRNA pseudouridine(55) synthase TruB [Propionibacteriaceae bacterium]